MTMANEPFTGLFLEEGAADWSDDEPLSRRTRLLKGGAKDLQQFGPRYWKSGTCDCTTDVRSCAESVFVPPYRFAKTAAAANQISFPLALAMYGVPWLVVMITYIIAAIGYQPLDMVPEQPAQTGWELYGRSYATTSAISSLCFAFMVGLGGVVRWRIRAAEGIWGDMCQDVLCHWCCTCCALAQEARQYEKSAKADPVDS